MACIIDPQVFAIQVAPLYPGKRNFWIIAVDDASFRARVIAAKDASARAALAQERFEKFVWHTLVPLLERGSIADVVGFDAQLKPEAAGVLKKRVRSDLPVNPNWVFIGGEFVYSGSKTELDWPWQAGLFDKCPENLVEGLWAVYTPAPAPHPEPGVLDTLGNTADDIAEDAKKLGGGMFTAVLIGAAVAAILLTRKR